MTPAQRKEIAHYLETGEDEDTADAWPGNVIDREIRQGQALRDALVAEVKRRTRGRRLRTPEVDPVALTRERVDPMVRGLFPKVEHAAVLTLLESSVVFVTPASIERVLREGSSWLSTTWNIANLYLRSIGAPLLGPDAPNVVGLSADLRCFVTAEYLEQRSSDFEACGRPGSGRCFARAGRRAQDRSAPATSRPAPTPRSPRAEDVSRQETPRRRRCIPRRRRNLRVGTRVRLPHTVERSTRL